MREYLNRFDPLNLNKFEFETDNKFGIPTILKENVKVDKLIPFIDKDRDGWCHFFLDDYRFERVWNNPLRYIDLLRQFEGVFSPDFSLYRDWPLAIQIWNTYRNRWCGVFWQMHGIKVIPTISWSDNRSYEFCFLGVEKGSTVAISTVGVMKNKESLKFFRKGYDEMIRRIQPEQIIIYGREIEGIEGKYFEPFYEKFEEANNGR